MSEHKSSVMERIVALCKRRGFIFQSSEIYGGINGFWDYGPLGVELKRNVTNAWWDAMVHHPPLGPDGKEFDMVGLESSIIMHPQVWKVSGHYDLFSDMMVDCRECKSRFRADKVWVVTILPYGAIRNTNVAKRGELPLDIESDSRSTCVAFEPDVAGLGYLVQQAVEAFGKKNKLKFLKEFSPQHEGTPGNRYVYIEAVDASKGWDHVSDHKHPDFECIVELLPTAQFNRDRRPCPNCHSVDSLTEPREFNLMFESYAGAIKDDENKVFLRPETAQGMFVNFKNVVDTSRVKIPFGIAQMGKSFRNEITPRNFIFRSREFEQMEMEFFCHPDDSEKWYTYWRDQRMKWYTDLGLKSSKLRLREHDAEELSHYSRGTADIEYAFPFLAEGDFGELEGIAHRGDFDLRSHMEGKLDPKTKPLEVEKDESGKPKYKGSGKDLTYFDPERKERFIPHVIEPAAGATRSTLAFICEAYTVDESRPSPELMMFHPRLAPIKAAVFPLVAKDGMPEIAEPIYRAVRKRWPAQYDAKQSIGKRYARMDEAGTPYCFTIDGQTKEDQTVTVRDRDTGHQDRIHKDRVVEYLTDKLSLSQ